MSKLDDIARAYVMAVELEERLARESPQLAEDISVLRADLHALLMDALREQKIPFTDRAEAAQLAYQITRPSAPR